MHSSTKKSLQSKIPHLSCLITALAVYILTWMSSCNLSSKTVNLEKPLHEIKNVDINVEAPSISSDTISQETSLIDSSLNTIRIEAQQIDDISDKLKDEKIKTDIKSHTTSIYAETDKIELSGKQLNSLISLLDDLDVSLKDLVDQNSKLKENSKTLSKANSDLQKNLNKALEESKKKDQEIVDLRSKDRAKLNAVLIGLIAASVIGLAISGFLSFTLSPKIGIPAMIACGIASTVSYSMHENSLLFSLIGLGFIGLVTLGGLAYAVWSLRKAAIETVKTTEAIKPLLDPSDRIKVFGENPIKPVADSIQSPSTKKIVGNIRKTVKKQ